MARDQEPSPIWNEEDLVPSEPQGFARDELVSCEACSRANPPTRTACIYCGAALAISSDNAALIKPTLRPLERWEQGFNAVLVTGQADRSTPELMREMGALLKLDPDEVGQILAAGVALPLARAATRLEAEVVETHLNALGLSILIVSDNELDRFPPKRLRAIELTDDLLVAYVAGSQSVEQVSWRDITLIVAGRRIVRRLELAERPAKKSEKEIVDSRELSSDEPRLDLYSSRDEGAWRISADNFDFSCLKESKGLMAAKNFQTLTDVLRERAVDAKYDDSYVRVRAQLSLVWPLGEHTESLGLRKHRIGRVHAQTATTSDNEAQLTRYSRLLHHLRQIDRGQTHEPK